MALTPMQFGQKKEKKTGWDTVAQTMQLVGTAVNAANGIDELFSAAKPPITPGAALPATSQNIAAYKPPAAPEFGSSLLPRRPRMGGF